jgi:hypothetical protein
MTAIYLDASALIAWKWRLFDRRHFEVVEGITRVANLKDLKSRLR